MYGLIPMYGIIAQPIESAEYAAKQQVIHHLPDGVEAEILDVSTMGDPVMDDNLSVEVEVVFPEVDSESELPDRDVLFPTAEGVSFLAVEAVQSEEERR
jgi:hypothetical protein